MEAAMINRSTLIKKTGVLLSILIVLMVFSISSCFLGWEDVDRFTYPVWSEDDTEIAYYRMKYKERRGDVISGFTNTRDDMFLIYTANPDGSDPVQIGDERSGTPGESYYMKEAGYILIDEYPKDGGESRYVVVRTNGTEDVLVQNTRLPSTDLIWALPSPDGLYIAVMTPEIWCPELEDYSSDCDGSSIYSSLDPDLRFRVGVEFINPETMEVLDAEPRIIEVDGVPEMAWQTDGTLTVVGNNSLFDVNDYPFNAYSMDPSISDSGTAGYIEGSVYPEDSCMYPGTSSSYISSDGLAIFAEGKTIYTESYPEESVFGCD
jgi:hypothetical protein